MKKICLLLVILLIIPLLFACSEKSEVSSVEMLNLTSGFKDFYTTKNIVCWQDAAAVYLAKNNLSDYNYSDAIKEPKTLTEKCGYVITISLLARQGNDVSAYKTDSFKSEIKTAVESGYDKLTVKELAMCFFAMTASNTEFDYEAAVKNLEKLQKDSGGFPVSIEYTYADVESSAYALNIIMLSRRFISDTCYDSVMTYLGNSINDNNTLSDIEGKQSAFTTALTLNSLITKIPMDGEISTALTKAIDKNFKLNDCYKRYADDTTYNREVTGEVLFCFATTAYGNLWTNLYTENHPQAT